MSEGREITVTRVVEIISPVPARALCVNGILHALAVRAVCAGGADRPRRLVRGGVPMASIRWRHGTPDPARIAPGPRDERAVLDRLRQRRLVDLLRARAGRLLRARAHARRVRA